MAVNEKPLGFRLLSCCPKKQFEDVTLGFGEIVVSSVFCRSKFDILQTQQVIKIVEIISRTINGVDNHTLRSKLLLVV